jgi:2-desacetyl-2-hydroxyethyl bacteriochlorophyllide A dehydrogenase
MRSLQTSGDAKLKLLEIPDYVAGEGEVLIRPLATGICGTDLDIIDGRIDPDFVSYPVTIGHEWCGVVVAHGDGVGEPAIGSRVTIEGIIPCGECQECFRGATNRCDAYSEIGFTRPGAAADLVAVPSTQVRLLDSRVSIESACLIEPASVVTQGIRKAHPIPGARVLIIGDGTIGLVAAKLVRHWKPSAVDLIGVREKQLTLAMLAGVDKFTIDRASLENSYDLVIEAAGSENAMSLGLEMLSRGGTLLALGFPGQGVTVPLNIDDLVNGDLTVVGSFGYSESAWAKTVDLLNSGEMDLSFLVTHTFALLDWSQAIDCLRNSEGVRGKVLLRIS